MLNPQIVEDTVLLIREGMGRRNGLLYHPDKEESSLRRASNNVRSRLGGKVYPPVPFQVTPQVVRMVTAVDPP